MRPGRLPAPLPNRLALGLLLACRLPGARPRGLGGQEDLFLDLVGSTDLLASPTDTEPIVVQNIEEHIDAKESRNDGDNLSDPLNTYLQVGDWIAQWDAPYEAWYFYNSNTGLSTWDKPQELSQMDFSSPEVNLETVKQNIKIQQGLNIENEVDTGDNTLRDNRDTGAGGHHGHTGVQIIDLTRDTGGGHHGDHGHSAAQTHGQHGHTAPVHGGHHGQHGCRRDGTGCGHGQSAAQTHGGHHGQHGCNRRDGNCGHHAQSQPLSFGQQTTNSGGGSGYFPSTPSYSAPATTAAPAYSAPATFPPASYGAPAGQDEYGSPQAGVTNSYTPADTDEYGSPQAGVSTGYAPPQSSYGLQPTGFLAFIHGILDKFRSNMSNHITRVPDFLFPLTAPLLGVRSFIQSLAPKPVGYDRWRSFLSGKRRAAARQQAPAPPAARQQAAAPSAGRQQAAEPSAGWQQAARQQAESPTARQQAAEGPAARQQAAEGLAARQQAAEGLAARQQATEGPDPAKPAPTL